MHWDSVKVKIIFTRRKLEVVPPKLLYQHSLALHIIIIVWFIFFLHEYALSVGLFLLWCVFFFHSFQRHYTFCLEEIRFLGIVKIKFIFDRWFYVAWWWYSFPLYKIRYSIKFCSIFKLSNISGICKGNPLHVALMPISSHMTNTHTNIQTHTRRHTGIHF